MKRWLWPALALTLAGCAATPRQPIESPPPVDATAAASWSAKGRLAIAVADEAAALVQQALQQTPDSAAVLDSMGWALHKQGKHSEAIDYLERARKSGADPEIDLHLGEVQWDMDQKTAARETWKKALERWPDDERLKERLERAGP